MLNLSPFGLVAIFPAALIGLLLWGLGAIARRPLALRYNAAVLFLLLWIAPTFLLYTAYYWISPHATIYLRLFLGIFPALIILACAAADVLGGGRPLLRIALSLILLGSALWMSVAAEEKLLEFSTLNWVSDEGSLAANDLLPEGSLLVADEMSAFHAVFATDFQVVTPLMFDLAQVQERLNIAQGPPPHELNEMRARRYLSLVANRSQEHLDDSLRRLLLQHLEKGQRVGLLTSDLYRAEGSPARGDVWSRRLAPSLALQEHYRGESTWTVYEITKVAR